MKVTSTETFKKTWEASDKKKLIMPRYRLSITVEDGELSLRGSVYAPTDQPVFFEALDKLVAQAKSELILAEK